MCFAASFNDKIFPHKCIFAYQSDYTVVAEAGAIFIKFTNCQRGDILILMSARCHVYMHNIQ